MHTRITRRVELSAGKMLETTEIAVIHLVRSGNDPSALERFISSYIQFPAGATHKLIFLLKGFGPDIPPSLSKLMDIVPHSKLNCPDRGFDLGSYFFAAERVGESVLMFTNSFSEVQGEGWLRKLLAAYSRPGVGLVGVTGSWESLSSQSFARNTRSSRSQFLDALARLRNTAVGLPLLLLFRPFPNIHLRTNGFLLGRREFLKMRPRMMRFKLNAWLFESGRHSMTRQVLKNGLDVLLVGRDGAVFRPNEWYRSKTFWQSDQENLLIHDNRTLAYQRGDQNLRSAWTKAAWSANGPSNPTKNGDSIR